jgi:hypothetical protein
MDNHQSNNEQYNLEPTTPAYPQDLSILESTTPSYLPDLYDDDIGIAPPPPDIIARHWHRRVMLALLIIVVVFIGSLGFGYASVSGRLLFHSAKPAHTQTLIKQSKALPFSTRIPTATPSSAPSLTANSLMVKFIQANIPIDGSADGYGINSVSASTWTACTPFSPSGGSEEWIDSTSNSAMRVGVFDSASDASLESETVTACWHWGVAYQVRKCLLVTQSVQVDVSPYQNVMQQDC